MDINIIIGPAKRKIRPSIHYTVYAGGRIGWEEREKVRRRRSYKIAEIEQEDCTRWKKILEIERDRGTENQED